MINSAGVAQKAFTNQQHIHSPDTIAKYIMCLDGAWEVWLDQMVEEALFIMKNQEAEDSKRNNKRRRVR